MDLLPHLKTHYGPRPPVGLFLCAARRNGAKNIAPAGSPESAPGVTRRGSGHMSEPLSFRRHPLIFVPDDALALLFFWRDEGRWLASQSGHLFPLRSASGNDAWAS